MTKPNMAEHSKGGIFTRAQKTLTRTKAKVLQNLGKAERTSDEKFDEHVHKLDKQQETAHKFQKELRAYIHAAKAMQNASRSLFATIQETYEEEWPGGQKIQENLQSVELMWSDYLQKLQERVQEPMATYVSHIPPLKTRISKRGRKLVDYDNARHNLDVLQNAKKKDENKISKAKDDAEQAKSIYTEMNDYLHTDLPEFYNSRVNLYGTTFENLFNAESMFHAELGRLSEELSKVSEQLAGENKFTYRPRPISKAFSHDSSHVNGENGDHTNGNSGYESSSPVATPTRPTEPPLVNGDTEDEGHHSAPESPIYQNDLSFQETTPLSPPQTDSKPDQQEETPELPDVNELQQPEVEDSQPQQSQDTMDEELPVTEEAKPSEDIPSTTQDTADSPPGDDAPDYPPPAVPENPPPEDIPTRSSPVMQMREEESIQAEEAESKSADTSVPVYDKVPPPVAQEVKEDSDKFNDDNLYEVPKNNAPVVETLPEGVLYKVVTTHSYTREDDDELTFDKGEIVCVMKYDGPEELDDGWLMGMLESNGTKGVFPENFTKRIN